MRQHLLNNLKNIPGWRTGRKLIALAVDDYGNVRVHSKKARSQMDKAGLKIYSRFDAYDALENREDLEQLFDVLRSVRDKNNRHAIFTPYALPCNINFEQMASDKYTTYQYECLPETYAKLAAMMPGEYEGAWSLWQEGIEEGLWAPQFHGREHLNLQFFRERLSKQDHQLITALRNRSFTSQDDSGYPTISYTAAFDFWEPHTNRQFVKIIHDGLNRFAQVFGYPATCFNAPGGRESRAIHPALRQGGIKYIEQPLIKKEHLGFGKYRLLYHYTGKRTKADMPVMVRNVVFEPTAPKGFDWVNFTLKQIETAFRWYKPAIISSHRVNFSGHINSDNRSLGLKALKSLLTTITKKWPDVEFVSMAELGDMIVGT